MHVGRGSRVSWPADAPGAPWLALNLHYHADQERLLGELVTPSVVALLDDGAIDRFFFVRYALGGPHVRLRLRATGGAREPIAGLVAARAADFFARCPSHEPVPAEVVQRHNRAILAGDPAEHDDRVHPDNSVREVPFAPETERYGGPELLEPSLDLFTLSSVAALEAAAEHRGEPRSRRLTGALRLLARQALGHARDAAELGALAAYAAHPAQAAFHGFAARADESFGRRADDLCGLLAREMLSLLEPAPAPLLAGARCLGRELAAAAPAARRRALASHLHMTANRLGLRNAEEVYVSRLLERAVRELAEREPALWSSIDEALRERAASATPEITDRLSDIVAAELRRFRSARTG